MNSDSLSTQMEPGLSILYPNDPSTSITTIPSPSLTLDILCLHGLNGSPNHTFTSQGKLWLRDLLPNDLPNARIMTFGYNATAAFENSVAGIEEHARDLLEALGEVRRDVNESGRSIIFVGHSLGGLVIKQALILASTHPDYTKLYTSTIGILFFGTPHQGSALANSAAAIARFPLAIANKPHPLLLETLKQNNPILKGLTENFKRCIEGRGIEIVSFYETRTMRGFKHLVVEKSSALLTPPDEIPTYEDQIPVDATHRDMCRFDSPKNKTYKATVRSIKRIIQGPTPVEVKSEYFLVPHTVSRHFTGRHEMLQIMKDKLVPNRIVKDQQRFVLYGLGGSGKTQMSLKFAQDHEENFWAIFWIDASTNETAKEGFLNIARTCKQEPNFDSIMAWLSGKENWLLIMDNADDPKLEISRFFPRGSKGSILITTRNPDFRKHATAGSSFKVDQMRAEDAVALLLKTAAVENVRDQEEKDAATAVVKVLGYFALAIIQAGAVIRQGLCSLRGFCELYAKQKKELLESGRAEPSIDYQYSVYTTWEISIRKIENIPDMHAKLALELLRLFAFMHFDAIKEEIFIKAQECRDLHNDYHDPVDGSIYRGTKIAKLMEADWDSVLFRKAVGVLVAFSLVSVDESERISMHPLVHEWSKARMTDVQRREGWKGAVSTLATSIRFSYTSIDEAYRRFLLPHISASMDGFMSRLFEEGPDLQERLTIAEKFSIAYNENFRCGEALDLELEILKGRLTIFPPEHLRILQTKEKLANIYSFLGRFQEALEIAEIVLESLKRNTGNDSQRVLVMTYQVAQWQILTGRSKLALGKILEAYETCERVLGKESTITMRTLDVVSMAYFELDEWEKSAKAGETALEVLKTVGGWNMTCLGTMKRVSNAYGMLKQFEESRRLCLRVVEITESSCGKESKEAAVALWYWATSTRFDPFWKTEQGVLVRKEALRRMEAGFGKTDLKTLQCGECLAESYYLRGLLRKARGIQEDQVNKLIDHFGEGHSETIDAKRLLARTRRCISIQEALYWWLPKGILNR